MKRRRGRENKAGPMGGVSMEEPMPPRQSEEGPMKEMLVLRYRDGLSMEEIHKRTSACGWSEHMVRHFVSGLTWITARGRLVKQLRAAGVDLDMERKFPGAGLPTVKPLEPSDRAYLKQAILMRYRDRFTFPEIESAIGKRWAKESFGALVSGRSRAEERAEIVAELRSEGHDHDYDAVIERGSVHPAWSADDRAYAKQALIQRFGDGASVALIEERIGRRWSASFLAKFLRGELRREERDELIEEIKAEGHEVDTDRRVRRGRKKKADDAGVQSAAKAHPGRVLGSAEVAGEHFK